jgi:hypothetical protein
MPVTRRWFSCSLWASTGGVVGATVPSRLASPAEPPAQASYRLDAPGAVTRTLGALAADQASVADFGADPTGTEDASPAFQAAIDFVASRGGGELAVPAGRYLVGELTLRARTYLVGVARFSYGAARFVAPSVLVRRPGARNILRAERIAAFGVENLELDGNPQPRDMGNGLDLADCGSIVVGQCKLARCAVGIETFPEAGSRYSGDLHVIKSMFRNNRIGLRLGQDSQVEGCDFSANTQCGAYVNAGQARLLGCRFEWNRDGERGPADGIYLHRNANEITIADCTFDRNAGHDLRVAGDVDKRPRHILVVGNLFKRAGWGSGADPSASVLVTAADDVSLSGNLYQFAGHEPAPTEGMPSPLQAAAFARCARIAFTGNALAGVGATLPLGAPSYAWQHSGAGWYLTRPRNEAGNPWLRQPEDIVLTDPSGPSAWRNADWSFGDYDGLGFDTIYLRGDDPAAHAVHAVYADPPVSFAECDDVRTDDLRDFAVIPIEPGAFGAALLRTRLLDWPAGRRLLRVYIALRSDDDEPIAEGLFELALTCRRTRPVGTACVTRMIEGGTSSPAIGVAGGAAEIGLEVRPAPLGDVVEILLRNTTARPVEAGLALLW